MAPVPGDRLQRFVGDRICFTLKGGDGGSRLKGWRARLRTNLGRAELLRREILEAHTRGLPLAGASWRDLPMNETAEGWSLELPLAEVGYFKAKAYLVDPRGWQHWPDGADVGIAVHPDRYRTANTLYCAFPRMFGKTMTAVSTDDKKLAGSLAPLDEAGYAVIPPSGKLRDLTRQLPHIIETLGCRILHLLPVHPTPTTYARFGRFGSPYAALDLTAIDPALVEFDKRTTGIDQFCELTYGVHLRGGRVFLDIVIDHTGWGSVLQENHPEWFVRNPDGAFASPGAWGTTWEDLVELKHLNVALWDELARIFLTWCRRGVDGFRCDAGYKVPVPAWQYIIARVQQDYPETIFFLEGLGGAWEATEALLTDGLMQWAYSELFQNYSGAQVAGYLDHSFKQSRRVGLLVHYSETHDNQRLAARGRAWSLLRNRLCALTSVSGGFGFTCGVEWLAPEQINVHDSTGLAWDSAENLVPELARLNALLADHPAFFDGAKLTRLSPAESPVYALRRESAEGKDVVLVLVNTAVDSPNSLTLAPRTAKENPKSKIQNPAFSDPTGWLDLLGQVAPKTSRDGNGRLLISLAPGAAYCLAPTAVPIGLHGDDYRRARRQAAWALAALSRKMPAEGLEKLDWLTLAAMVERSPAGFLAALGAAPSGGNPPPGVASSSSISASRADPEPRSSGASAPSVASSSFPRVITWSPPDLRGITVVPPGHWLLLEDTVPFRATLVCEGDGPTSNVESIPVRDAHIACFPPREVATDATLLLERYGAKDPHIQAPIRFLDPAPNSTLSVSGVTNEACRPTDLVLLTNGRGGMCRLCLDLGRVNSKYDCVLGANLHPTLPVDRHILAKRIRVWVSADGFISPLAFQGLARFESGPPATWSFVAKAGDGRTVEIQMTAAMIEGRNTTVFGFHRPTEARAAGKQLPAEADVRLTVRLDIEDRGFHSETKRNSGAEYHFSSNTHILAAGSADIPVGMAAPPKSGKIADAGKVGFAFTPASDRQLRVFSNAGVYHPQPEWCENIPHPNEQTRGQTGSGDAFSPGWFDLPLPKGANVGLVVTADPSDPSPAEIETSNAPARPQAEGVFSENDGFGRQLLRAIRAFVVRRGTGKTVIAGYPWFLDWGRDTFICARGLLAAGMEDEVKQLLLTFARFEQNGTLPNTIFGEDASNRDTSDAPLWFGLVCEELAAAGPNSAVGPVYSAPVPPGRTLLAVLRSIALNYIKGTSNGIRMDPASALIWSPSHFTWMDTNYPACTPREGYPVEIQALWIRLLRQLARVDEAVEKKRWQTLAAQALDSLNRCFWREEKGYYADVLLAKPGQAAAAAVADTALRSNCLFVVSLGLVEGERAKRCVEAVRRHLVVPGALRTLAPLPVSVPLPNYGSDGRLLNNPLEPYWGRYEGDEDTRRKPAYHNGTAWTWTFPVFCEALARAWDFAPEALGASVAYLGSMDRTMAQGCLGQLPEIVDGDAPHAQRGCDAQAWGATEALRVWKLLWEKTR
jgi:predicted glycogen debranching enzyme